MALLIVENAFNCNGSPYGFTILFEIITFLIRKPFLYVTVTVIFGK